MTGDLNQRTARIVELIEPEADELNVSLRTLDCGGRLFDFGIETSGSREAGILLASICMAGWGEVTVESGKIDTFDWPHVAVGTDRPVEACLLSQYAGWQIVIDKYFAMGSGPMRSAAAVEELFDKLQYRETPTSVVGVLETAKLPDDAVFGYISEKTGVPPEEITLCVAPTASEAGNLQIVARSVETSLHKLFELGFDVKRIFMGHGSAPLPPVAPDDMTGIGMTNDAILYGGRVTLSVTGDDESLSEIGPKVPALASECYGKPFLEIFEEAGRDFYAIDPHLFSPAEIVFENIDTGNVHQFGKTAPDVLKKSFGI